jgi:putative ABC transport system substrate-binding protein
MRCMNRRRLLAWMPAAGLALGVGRAIGQTPGREMRRVGVLAPSTAAKEEVILKPFFDEMRKLGWVEGRNIRFDRAYADDRPEVMQQQAGALVLRTPEVVYAPPMVAATAVKQVTATIPIVFATGIDPVGTGLVDSLAQPGGNVTGISSIADSLAPKRVELWRQIRPNASRFGVIGDPDDANTRSDRAALAALSDSLGLEIVFAPVTGLSDLDAAIGLLAERKVDVVLSQSSLLFNLRERLLEQTRRRRLPVIGPRAELAADGSVLSYGSSLAEQIRRSAHLVDKVLKGAKPGEIPMEQPSTFELVVNLQAARALGITIPKAVLLQAEQVIE